MARRHREAFCTATLGCYEKSNMRFVKGLIEMLPEYLEPDCVMSLSSRKDKVLRVAAD